MYSQFGEHLSVMYVSTHPMTIHIEGEFTLSSWQARRLAGEKILESCMCRFSNMHDLVNIYRDIESHA